MSMNFKSDDGPYIVNDPRCLQHLQQYLNQNLKYKFCRKSLSVTFLFQLLHSLTSLSFPI